MSFFNCSYSNSGSPWLYNASQSPSEALQLCRRLLDAKCAHMGLDQSYCSSSHSPKTANHILSIYQSSFCESYFNTSDSIASLIIGLPIVGAFLLNAAFLVFRSPPHHTSAEKSELSMVNPVAQDAMFVLAQPLTGHSVEANANSLGAVGRALPFLGMQWLRAPKSSPMRQALRLFFVLYNVLAVVPMLMKITRMSFPGWKGVTFLTTYNQCSSLCETAGGGSCPQLVQVLLVCQEMKSEASLRDLFECLDSRQLDSLSMAGLIVNIVLLLLPLHSAIACALLWSRAENPVLLAIQSLRHLSPNIHRQCCAAVMKMIAVLALALFSLGLYNTRIQFAAEQSNCKSAAYLSCPAVKSGLIYADIVLAFILNAFLSICPLGMVLLYTFTAFIARVRMHAFVTVVRFIASATSVLPPKSTELTPITQEVLSALLLCRCPHSLLLKCRAMLVDTSKDGRKDAANAMKSQLQLLWMIQMREVNLLSKFGEKWLLSQALIVVLVLLPLATFCTLASLYPAMLPRLVPLLAMFFLFAAPFFAAISALAIGNFFVKRACRQLKLLLRSCVQVAETDDEAFGPVFTGHESLAATVAFCCFTSEDAFCVFGVQIDWKSLGTFLYHMGLVVWVLSTSLLPNGIFRKSV